MDADVSLLRSAVSVLHKRLRKQMYSIETLSITEVETVTHLFLRGALLPSELAGLTKIKTQSMSQVLNKMEEKNIIKRTPSKDDRRKILISLTAHGKKIVDQTRYERDEWLANAIKTTLTDKEQKEIKNIINILNKLASAT